MCNTDELTIARRRLLLTLKNLEYGVRIKSEQLPILSGSDIAGIVYGNVSNASTIYGMDKFSTPRGHGFAAERANHLYDKVTGKNAKIVGDDNAKWGADRTVDNVNIQSKYCATGSKCISECFENGSFKYINVDGSPMQVEVPSDKYDAAVQAMKDRIAKGEVPGVTDPEEAKNIVRKGHFTYEQAKNIARAGTVESITFDAVNGVIIAANTFGISFLLSFATSIWHGDNFATSLKCATYAGLKVGGTSFVTAVLASQLSRAGLNSMLVGSSEMVVKLMGPKASALLVNAFRHGKNIYGAAAMKSAAKMLRGNVITAGISVAVLSSVDVVNIFRGRISGKQLFKNITATASSVAGGSAGWVGGTAAGAAIGSAVPVIGTAVGGLVGGLVGAFAGGALTGKASHAVLDKFIEDDADAMVKIIEQVFTQMATDYLLNQKEAEAIIDNLKEVLTGKTLKDMFASKNRAKFAKDLLTPYIEKQVKKRPKVQEPSSTEVQKTLRHILEDIADQFESYNTISKFEMKIDDVFAITGRGTVAVGCISKGEIAVGDLVKINKSHGETITAKVEGIEVYRKFIDKAKEGDTVGLRFSSVRKEDLNRGDFITMYDDKSVNAIEDGKEQSVQSSPRTVSEDQQDLIRRLLKEY